jgi:hypothetical protein
MLNCCIELQQFNIYFYVHLSSPRLIKVHFKLTVGIKREFINETITKQLGNQRHT